jgi:hypothetical protein
VDAERASKTNWHASLYLPLEYLPLEYLPLEYLPLEGGVGPRPRAGPGGGGSSGAYAAPLGCAAATSIPDRLGQSNPRALGRRQVHRLPHKPISN